jgi:hypothetical protein
MQAVMISTSANDPRDEFSATWMLVTENADLLKQPEIARVAKHPATIPGLRLWTDDYSGLLPVLQW